MRNTSRLGGFCLVAVFSAIALGGGTAQASEFRIEGKTFAELAIKSKEIKGSGEEGELLTEGGIVIHCTSGTASGVIHAGGTGEGETLLNGCTLLENKQCHIYEDLGIEFDRTTLLGEGHMKVAGKAQLLLMEGKHYILTEGAGPGGTLTTFDIYGKFCPLNEGTNPLQLTVHGSSVGYLPDILEEAKVHEAQSLEPKVLRELFPEHRRFIGAEEMHLGGGLGPLGVILASGELTSGEVWSAE